EQGGLEDPRTRGDLSNTSVRLRDMHLSQLWPQIPTERRMMHFSHAVIEVSTATARARSQRGDRAGRLSPASFAVRQMPAPAARLKPPGRPGPSPPSVRHPGPFRAGRPDPTAPSRVTNP